MQSLKVYRDKSKGVSDLLNWAALVDDGLILCKDGTILGGFYYKCKDIASATTEEREYLTSRINATLCRLDKHWTVYQDAVRMPSCEYPDRIQSFFPDPITSLIDEENRQKFISEGNHFETYYVLILAYTPPFTHQSMLARLVYDRGHQEKDLSEKHYAYYHKTLQDIADSLHGVLKLTKLKSHIHKGRFGEEYLRDDLVNYLHFACTGLPYPLNIPNAAMYLDTYICGQELWVGNMPLIGENFICCVAIDSFPSHSYANMLERLEHLPISYRWSNRMIMLDQHESVDALKGTRRKWLQKQRGFFSQIFKTQSSMVNQDALTMAKEAEAAINDSNSGTVAFGYYTGVFVLMGEDKAKLQEDARLISRELQQLGFGGRVETINTMEAWLGSLPGHNEPNVRRNLIHTMNLADMLPLSSIWPGEKQCPNPLYPAGSPPLLYGATSGATPFRLNLHIGDVGHTLVFGPTGAGKSTLLATICAQFRRYKDATIFAFDKGNSLWTLVNAAGGKHYDIASDSTPNFAPLSVLETDSDMMWAEEWIANCFELQTGSPPTPAQRREIHRAMVLLRDTGSPEHRSVSEFTTTVQDKAVRDALNYYTISGSMGKLLDSHTDGLKSDSFTVLEIEELMALGDKAAIPVLLYLFRRFEKSLKGQPALLVLDEAWVMLGHPVFREKIREWLKVLRKANCACVLATQSLSDAVRSGIFDVLIESCPTKILLPNEEANKGGTEHHPGPKDLYTVMGLNEAELHILETAQKKRHYYYVSAEGRRLFDLGLGPAALSFVAVSDKETLTRLRKLKETQGDDWPYAWLTERKVNFEALLQ